MPWLTIILALLSFFAAKKSGASTGGALLAGGLAGAGTYWVTHETEWGQANLGALDGVAATPTGKPLLGQDGKAVIDPITGKAMLGLAPTVAGGNTTAGGTGVLDVLKSWGATGTATVVGAAGLGLGAATGNLSSFLPIALIAGIAILVLK